MWKNVQQYSTTLFQNFIIYNFIIQTFYLHIIIIIWIITIGLFFVIIFTNLFIVIWNIFNTCRYLKDPFKIHMNSYTNILTWSLFVIPESRIECPERRSIRVRIGIKPHKHHVVLWRYHVRYRAAEVRFSRADVSFIREHVEKILLAVIGSVQHELLELELYLKKEDLQLKTANLDGETTKLYKSN